jgi:hypothetical protein
MSCNRELYEVAVVIGTSKPPAGKVGPILPSAANGIFIANVRLVFFQGVPRGDANDVCGFKASFLAAEKAKAVSFVVSVTTENQTSLQRVATADDKDETLPAARVFVRRRDETLNSSVKTGIGVELTDVTFAIQETSKGEYMVSLAGGSAARKNF